LVLGEKDHRDKENEKKSKEGKKKQITIFLLTLKNSAKMHSNLLISFFEKVVARL